MSAICIIIIAITTVISYQGFKDRAFFEKYKFNVAAITRKKEYIRLLSSGFLHADWMHLFFNMLSLYFFQGIVEYYFGTGGFLALYFGSMLLGNLFSLYIYKHQPWYSSIGVSGAVSGIIFAAIGNGTQRNRSQLSIRLAIWNTLFWLLRLYDAQPQTMGQFRSLCPLRWCGIWARFCIRPISCSGINKRFIFRHYVITPYLFGIPYFFRKKDKVV